MPFRVNLTKYGVAFAASVLEVACSVCSAQARLKMSTTTSTDKSGLLNVLLPPFERECRCKVDVIAVGTGKALRLSEQGDFDVVLIHARALEDKFVANGFGINRRDVMYNDFVARGGGMTVVISSHDERLGERLGAKMIYLEDGMLSSVPEQFSSVDLFHDAEGNHANS
jgi:ABC-type tungstate transport system permease subunit